jgi:hypothetical protein
MSEERRLRVLENRVLRTFGPKREERTGELKRLHKEELNYVYFSHITFRVMKSKRMKWTGHVARMGDRKGVHSVSVGKSEIKRPFG